jgi:hypothetical protein
MDHPRDDSAEDAALARRIAADRDASAESILCRRLIPRIRAYGMRHMPGVSTIPNASVRS